MKKTFLAIAVFFFCASSAFAQSYNFNIGGLQFSSGAAVPGSCSPDGRFFFKNTATKDWYKCIAGSYVSMGLPGAGVVSVPNGGTGQSQAGVYGVNICRTGVLVTQSTQAEAVAFTCTVPAGLLTANGIVKINFIGKAGTLTGAATWRVRFAASGSGLTGTVVTAPTTSVSTANIGGEAYIYASGATTTQVAGSNIRVTSGTSNDVNTTGAVNTASAWDIVITLQLVNADASGITLQAASVVVFP